LNQKLNKTKNKRRIRSGPPIYQCLCGQSSQLCTKKKRRSNH